MRMYFFTNMYLSSIQKGIQSGHCALEYAMMFSQSSSEYKDFMNNHKTWIVLDGGWSFDKKETGDEGSMELLVEKLEAVGINHATFREPSLNNALTAICFLVPECVYNMEDYPDFEEWSELADGTLDEWREKVIGGRKNEMIREIIRGKKLAI